MKVKDIINARHDLPSIEVETVIKPKGTKREYYNDDRNHLENEVAEMEVKEWFIIPSKKNKCTFLIIVEQNKEYEEKKDREVEKFFNKV